jgi:hydrogenase maturation protease
MLIIGCGNRERGDDAAGVLVLEKLRGLAAECAGVRLKTCSGEATELMESWDADDEVVLIDAVVTGAEIGTVHCWRGNTLPQAGSSSASTHGFGIHEAISLAKALDRLPKSLRVYGIEGRQFATGSTMSAEVRRAVARLAEQIRTEALTSAAC